MSGKDFDENLGRLLVRLPVGILILFHVNSFLHGDPGIPSHVAAWGLPAFFAWIGVGMEGIGALLAILGIYARVGGLLIGLFMLAAFVMAHAGLMGQPNHFFMTGPAPAGPVNDHYMLESQMFYFLGGFAVFLLGAGRFGANIGGRWN
jgi:putative oxidoreductase